MSPEPTPNPRLQSALAHARHGRSVLPVFWARDGRCGCGAADCASPAKHPIPALAPRGVKHATTSAVVIRAWWTQPRPQFEPLETRTRGYATAALASEEQQLLATAPGQRNQRLNLAAFRLARFITSGALSQAHVEHVLFTAALRLGLSEREA